MFVQSILCKSSLAPNKSIASITMLKLLIVEVVESVVEAVDGVVDGKSVVVEAVESVVEAVYC